MNFPSASPPRRSGPGRVVALAAVLTSGAPAQSLGDVARKEEARRKGWRRPRSTRTTICAGRRAPAATSPAHPARRPTAASGRRPRPDGQAARTRWQADKGDTKADAKTDAKADAKTGCEGRCQVRRPEGDAASWRKRRQDLQDALDRSKVFADALQSRINALTADFSARDDPAQRSDRGRRSPEGARPSSIA